MSIAQDLSDVLEAAGQPLARLDTLAQHIPQEWIEAAALFVNQHPKLSRQQRPKVSSCSGAFHRLFALLEAE